LERLFAQPSAQQVLVALVALVARAAVAAESTARSLYPAHY